MSDFIWNNQKLTNFLNNNHKNNYESFKQLLYGSRGKAHNDRTVGSDQSAWLNHKDDFNDYSTERNNSKAQHGNGPRQHEYKECANRRKYCRRNQETLEYSHFDELERLSSCLIRLLEEARNERGKVVRHSAIEQDFRPDINFYESLNNYPDADLPVATASNQALESPPDRRTQVNPQSPECVGIGSTSISLSEVESILNDLQDDVHVDTDLSHITPSLVEYQYPGPVGSDDVFSTVREAVQSTKPTPWEYKKANSWDKAQKKKENHNMIERRRRCHINDRIKELAALLPCHTNAKTRQNKGSVLKASVEYIKKLRKDQERFGKLEEEMKQNELNYKRLMFRIQKLELMVMRKRLKKSLPDCIQAPKNGTKVNVSQEAQNQQASGSDKESAQPSAGKDAVLPNLVISTASTTTLNLDDITDDSSMLSFSPQSTSSCFDEEDSDEF